MSRDPKSKLPPEWQVYTNVSHKPKKVRRTGPAWWKYVVWALLLLALGGVALLPQAITAFADNSRTASQGVVRHFSLCHTGGGTNCVVDGDTVWMDGVKIRVADIDAPETHPSRCEREADLGNRATLRLQQLMNAGPVSAETNGREEDRYGRKLRVLTRDGQSLGETLVQEGLARPWGGSRQPWC